MNVNLDAIREAAGDDVAAAVDNLCNPYTLDVLDATDDGIDYPEGDN
jgi:hypothetical protein